MSAIISNVNVIPNEVEIDMDMVPPMNNYGNVCMEFEFDEGELEKHWDHISQNSFAAESCFFNCQTEKYKETILEYLDEVESAITDYAQCVLEWLQTVKFVEKSRPVPPLPPGAFYNDIRNQDQSSHDPDLAYTHVGWHRQPYPERNPDNGSSYLSSHPVNRVTHSDVVTQIQEFEVSQNLEDLIGLRYKVEVMKECVRTYVEINRKNTVKYIIDERDPDYSSYPAWMFFPLLIH